MSLQFESGIKQIPYSQQRVFDKLSDFTLLKEYEDRLSEIPSDTVKVEDLRFNTDSVSCRISPLGSLDLHIIEREEPKCIKYEATTSPIPLTIWAQILPTGDESCKLKMTLGTELNFLLKGMLQKPLQEVIEKLADALAVMPY